MSKIKKIMVAVDFSEYSPGVVDYAARLAEDLTAELIFVNVINQRDINMVKQVTMYTDKISVKSYVDGLKQDRTEEMQKLVEEKNCTRIPNRFIIKTGTPFEELIRAADQEKAGMVVMGTKGRGNIAGILLGSQAEKMFRHCPVPLLSIRENENEK
ncbi:MAG: universal stress protein [Desulfobacteraceae bacterium]|jgi:nucleotide-binding universal stress UspA family protein|nr:universal stress protein [Desulfobacteraceae bacterium]